MNVTERARRQRRQVESRATIDLTDFWPTRVTNPATLTQQVWDGSSAVGIPSVAKALLVYQLAGVMSLDCFRGVKPMPRPRLLEQPDLTSPGTAEFIMRHVADWLIAGNACHLITSRDSEGWPASVRWRPARQWQVEQTPEGEIENYRLNGKRVPVDDVVHVRRAHHPGGHSRGIGIVEQHLRTLDRSALEEESERQNLKRGAVPSVAVIAPQKELTQTEADDAADAWDEKLSGPGRRPAVLPNGSQVIPLSWSASDQQSTEARKLTLTDVANLTGMDGYWLGAPGSSHTYRSPGPLWLALLRTTLEPMLAVFEQAWSQAWVPRGKTVRFNRLELTRDELGMNIRTLQRARDAGLFTYEEARVYLGMDPDVPEPKREPVAAPIAIEPDTEEEQEDDQEVKE